MEKKNAKLKIVISIIGIIVGVVTVIMGLSSYDFNWHYNGTVSKTTYGGDAYTGIQNAAAQTASNVYNVYTFIQAFAKMFFIVLGVLIVLHYVEKLFESLGASKPQVVLSTENEKINAYKNPRVKPVDFHIGL